MPPEAALKPQPPPAPRLPSATVPLVFGLLGLAASAVLPAVAFCAWNRVGAVLLSLAASLLIPFAPCAWWAGQRYEARCLELGFRPAPSGRAGRGLGTAATLLLAALGSVILFLDALRRLDAP